MDSRFIINLSGNDFVLHEGLLNEFHANGGTKITTELLSSDNGVYLFKATVEGAKGVYTGHGDANQDNVNSMVGRHLIRMAETRAINRALRFYNNIGMCSVDELGGDDSPKKHIAERQPPKAKESKDTVKFTEDDLRRIAQLKIHPSKTGNKNGRAWFLYELDGRKGFIDQAAQNFITQNAPNVDLDSMPF